MSKDASPSTRGAVRAWSSAPPSPAQARAAAASSASLSSSPSAFGSSASPPFATSVPKLFAALESRADQKARKKRQKQRGGRAARKVHPGRAGEMSEVGAGGAGGAGERRHERGDDGDGAVPLAAAVEKYPMYLIPVTSFMKLMEHVPAHQDLLEHGLLVEYEPDMEGRVIFVSHEWCAANNPDPDGVQMRCLQEVLRRMMYGELARIETNWKHQFAFKDNPHVTSKDMKAVCHMYLWIDYMCMPQPMAGPMPSRADELDAREKASFLKSPERQPSRRRSLLGGLMSPREPELPTLRLTDDTAQKLQAMSSTRLIADEESRRDSRSSPKRSVEEEEEEQQQQRKEDSERKPVWMQPSTEAERRGEQRPRAFTGKYGGERGGEDEGSGVGDVSTSSDHRIGTGETARLLDLATESIPAYVEKSSLMIILVPMCKHKDRPVVCTLQSWRGRGWCRMELLAAVLARKTIRVMTIMGAAAQPEFIFPADALYLAPGRGAFTCCSMGHRFAGKAVECDKVKLRLVLRAMLPAKIHHLFAQARLFEARYFSCIGRLFWRGMTEVNLSGVSSLIMPLGTDSHVARSVSSRRQADIGSPGAGNNRSLQVPPVMNLHGEEGGGAKDVVDALGGSGSDILVGSATDILKERLRWRTDEDETAWASHTGTSLLFWAVVLDYLPAVRELLAPLRQTGSTLKRGADLDAAALAHQWLGRTLAHAWPALTLFRGKTVLHMAVAWGSLGIMTALLQAGADPFARCGKARLDSILLASSVGMGGTGNLSALLELHPAWDVSYRDKMTGSTALHLGANFSPEPKAMTKTLIALGFDTVAVNALGATMLHSLCGNANADADAVLELLKYPSVLQVLNMPMSPRSIKFKIIVKISRLAVRLGSKNLLFRNFASLHNQTALHCAARWGNIGIVQALVDAGADIGAVDGRGLTPLQGAEKSFGEVPEILAAMLSGGSRPSERAYGVNLAHTSESSSGGGGRPVPTLKLPSRQRPVTGQAGTKGGGS